MEQHLFLRDKAVEKINVADHMLFMTYPVVKDPKLLLAVVENVFASLDYGVGAILHHQRRNHKIPNFQETFSSRFALFQRSAVPMLSLSPNYVKLISDVRTLLSAHRKSPITFVKKDKFIICSPKYEIRSLDVGLVKKYIFETKIFVSQMNKIVSKDERSII